MEWHVVDTRTQVIVAGDWVGVLRANGEKCSGSLTHYVSGEQDGCFQDVTELIIFTGTEVDEIKKKMEGEIKSE